MAHAIDQTTGRTAVFVTGEPVWHRLGVVIERATTSVEAIGLAGLDWRVEQWPVRAFDPDNHSVEAGIPDTVANVRTDTKAVLGVVGKRYRVFQNHEAFDFMDSLVGDKLAMYETAGSLHGGKRVWMMASIPKEYRAGPDDLIKPYVLLTNTHDGSQALRMIPTTVRVVCQNTLNLALREAGVEGLTISHHPKLESRVAEARAKLGIIAARFDTFDDELHAMLEKDLSITEAGGYFRGLSGIDLPGQSDRQKKSREQIHGQMLSNFDNDRNTLAGIKHTAHGLHITRSANGRTISESTGGPHPLTSWTGSWIRSGSANPIRSNKQPIAERWNWPERCKATSPRTCPPAMECRCARKRVGDGLGSGRQRDAAQQGHTQTQRRFIMASYNRVILMGHLARDPELQPNTDTAVCDFPLAVKTD